jgi:hypothetical protein
LSIACLTVESLRLICKRFLSDRLMFTGCDTAWTLLGRTQLLLVDSRFECNSSERETMSGLFNALTKCVDQIRMDII